MHHPELRGFLWLHISFGHICVPPSLCLAPPQQERFTESVCDSVCVCVQVSVSFSLSLCLCVSDGVLSKSVSLSVCVYK